MELTPKQQVTELIKKFNRILLVAHARPDGDALGSLLAFHHVLEALGKKPTTVVRDEVPEMLEFLPGTDKLSKQLAGSNDLIVSVDISKTPVDKLKYNTRDDRLNVVISPKQGAYTEKDVQLRTGSFQFDLIIVLDCPDLDRVGTLYEEQPDLFYETPVVNIDHHPSNDYFGAVNLVDLTATSTAEILVGLFESLGDSLITEDVATALLTGLVTDTGSFQNSNTTPKSLTVSAQLVAVGGRQQEIIQHVYRTKPISTLKLWGRALTKLQYDPETRFVWSSLSSTDFADTGGTTTDAKAVIDALMTSAPNAEIVLLLRETDGAVDASVRTAKGVDATEVVGFWNGGGHTGAAGFDVPGSLDEVEPKVVKQIKKYQLDRLEKATEESKEQSVPEEPQQSQPDRPEPRQTESVPTQTSSSQIPPEPVPTQPATQQAVEPVAPRVSDDAADPQPPLSDEQLDAYFRRTSGGKGSVIDQQQKPPASSSPAAE